MFPNETADPRVVWDDFEATIGSLIMGGWAVHATVIHKWFCNVRNLGIENERDITMKYLD